MSVSELAGVKIEERTSNSIVESLLGKVTGLIWGVENLVIEDREIQGKTKADRVGRSKISGRDLGCGFVGLQ